MTRRLDFCLRSAAFVLFLLAVILYGWNSDVAAMIAQSGFCRFLQLWMRRFSRFIRFGRFRRFRRFRGSEMLGAPNGSASLGEGNAALRRRIGCASASGTTYSRLYMVLPLAEIRPNLRRDSAEP